MVRNMVFSSVGDNTIFYRNWESKLMNYDIYIIYYGDNDILFKKYEQFVKFAEKRKGSKFQNFKYFYDKYPEIIEDYDQFFILDDDILIDAYSINQMFDISNKYKLKICAPSFSESSKISWDITKHIPNAILSYTNFVEVNCPLFSIDALHNLMRYLHYGLIGWGIDILMIWANGLYNTNKYAIIHKITCINPTVKDRELNKIAHVNIRNKLWEDYCKLIDCKYLDVNAYSKIVYKTIYI